jgi:hypothetical protein
VQLSRPSRTHKKSGLCRGRLPPLRHRRSRLLQEVKTALSDGRKQLELVEVDYLSSLPYATALVLERSVSNETQEIPFVEGQDLGETAGDASSVIYSS